MQRVTRQCFRVLWQSFAVLLVLLAVLVTVLKYSLPHANQYRSNIETMLRERFAVELYIGEISAEWRGTGPAVLLNNISFHLPESSDFDLTIGQVAFSLDFWQTILSRELRSDQFELRQVTFNLQGRSLLRGQSNQQTASGDAAPSSALEPLSRLFLGQLQHFKVTQSQVRLTMPSGVKHQIVIDNLWWQNQGEQHLGRGAFRVAGLTEDQLELRIQLQGEQLQDVSGTAYVHGQQLDLSSWFAQFVSNDVRELKTDANFAAWLNIDNGVLQNIMLQFADNSLSWQQDGQNRRLQLKPTAAQLTPRSDGFAIKTDPLQLAFGQREFARTQVSLDKAGRQWQGWVANLDAQLLRGVLPLFAKQQSWFNEVEQLQVSAQLQDSYFRFSDQHWAVVSDYQQLGWNAVGQIPGIAGLDGAVALSDQGGRLNFAGNDGHLLTGPLFRQPIGYQRLSASLQVKPSAQGWQLSSRDVWLMSDELTLAAGVNITLAEQPEMALYAEISGANAEQANNYYPLPYMPKATMAFLNSAIEGGSLNLAQVLWQGEFAKFPFRDKTGVFEVLADVSGGQLLFDANWPKVRDAQATLHFKNERMDIYSSDAWLAQLHAVNPVHVYIPDLLDASQLFIDVADGEPVDTTAVSSVFEDSPLSSISQALSQLSLSAPINAQAQIIVDLNELTTLATGTVNLAEQSVTIAGPNLTIDNLAGQLQFVNEKLSLQNGRGTLTELPVRFSLDAAQSKQGYKVSIDAEGKWQTEQIFQQYPSYWQHHISGQLPWQLAMELYLPESGFHYNAQLTSNLQQLRNEFAAPYHIDDTAPWQLQAIVQGDAISNLITLQVPERLYINGIFDNQSRMLDQLHVIVGQQDLGLSTYPFEVSVSLADTELQPWLPLLADIVTPSEQAGPSWLPSLNRLNVAVQKLDAAGFVFDDLQLNMDFNEQQWRGQFRSQQAVGRLSKQFSEPLANSAAQPIRIDLDWLRVNLPEAAEPVAAQQTDEALAEVTEPVIPQLEQPWLYHAPALDIRCVSCRLGPYQLDKVRLLAAGDGQQLTIEQLKIERDLHQLQLAGQYSQGHSALHGQITSKNFGALLSEYGLTSTVKDSSADIDFALDWQGAPYDLDLPTLAGQVQWRLGEGYLAEVSDQGARIFSLLSLDSLVRKLRLDFRDVFAKGMFYNSMQGSVRLEQGVAYTEDTTMDGVAGDLRVAGYTNLNNEQIHYELGFTPKVTSSLPVIVAWMVNPVSGLAALALDKVLHSANVISELRFTIDGSIKQPKIQEIERKSKEIVLPEPVAPKPAESAAPSDGVSVVADAAGAAVVGHNATGKPTAKPVTPVGEQQ